MHLESAYAMYLCNVERESDPCCSKRKNCARHTIGRTISGWVYLATHSSAPTHYLEVMDATRGAEVLARSKCVHMSVSISLQS